MIPAQSRSVDLLGPIRDRTEIELGGEVLEIKRARLGVHLLLGEQEEVFEAALEARDCTGVSRALIAYLSIATGIPSAEIRTLGFVECGNALGDLRFLNVLTFIPPFLENVPEDRPQQFVPWDYVKRSLLTWVHILASNYHWSRKEILELTPEEALAFVQEIIVEQQLQREWEWSLSEACRTYDPITKKTKFHPLPRPNWMVSKREDPKNPPQIPRILLPVGKVISLGEGAPNATEVIQPPVRSE